MKSRELSQYEDEDGGATQTILGIKMKLRKFVLNTQHYSIIINLLGIIFYREKS